MRNLFCDISATPHVFIALEKETVLRNHLHTFNGELLASLADYIFDETHQVYKGIFPAGRYVILYKYYYENDSEIMFIIESPHLFDHNKINDEMGGKFISDADYFFYQKLVSEHHFSDDVTLYTAPKEWNDDL